MEPLDTSGRWLSRSHYFHRRLDATLFSVAPHTHTETDRHKKTIIKPKKKGKCLKTNDSRSLVFRFPITLSSCDKTCKETLDMQVLCQNLALKSSSFFQVAQHCILCAEFVSSNTCCVGECQSVALWIIDKNKKCFSQVSVWFMNMLL